MTAGMETGLRHRLRRALRHIEAQHRNLEPLRRELHRATLQGSGDDVLEWLARYADALLAHFALEESSIFPALYGVATSARDEIEALARDHEEFRERLAELRERLTDGSRDELDAFERALRGHESREESLLASLVRPLFR